MVRVLSPLAIGVMLLLLTISAAAASVATGANGIRASVETLGAAQPRTAGITEAVAGAASLPSTSTTPEYLGLVVALALLAAAAVFVFSLRRRTT